MNQRANRNAIEASYPADSKEPKATREFRNQPEGLDEGAIFEAALIARRFFEMQIPLTGGRNASLVAATMANAAATIYAANIQAKQAPRRTRKAVKS